MKVLLDENLDHRLRKDLGDHEVLTVRYMGWSGLGNGDLLRAAEENGIEVLVTGDQNLTYQQNLAGRQIALLRSRLSTGQFFGTIFRWLSLPSITQYPDRFRP